MVLLVLITKSPESILLLIRKAHSISPRMLQRTTTNIWLYSMAVRSAIDIYGENIRVVGAIYS